MASYCRTKKSFMVEIPKLDDVGVMQGHDDFVGAVGQGVKLCASCSE